MNKKYRNVSVMLLTVLPSGSAIKIDNPEAKIIGEGRYMNIPTKASAPAKPVDPASVFNTAI